MHKSVINSALLVVTSAGLLAAPLPSAVAVAQNGPGGNFGGGQALPSPPPPRSSIGNPDAGERDFDYKGLTPLQQRQELLKDDKAQSENWDYARLFSRCAVNLNADRARALLDQATGGERLEVEDYLKRSKGCVRSSQGLDRDFLRGALAEQLVAGEAAGNPAIPGPGDTAKVMSFIKSVKLSGEAKSDPFAAGQLVAECRVGFAPTAARAVMAMEPGSEGEKGALAALRSVTPQCDALAQDSVAMSSWFERALASQALYHWIAFAEKGT